MARLIHYEDLALEIEPGGEEGYRVRLLASPYGLSVAPFALPFHREDLERMIVEVGAAVHLASVSEVPSSTRHLAPPSASTLPTSNPANRLRSVGARLFRALFNDALAEIYLLCRGRTESTADRGLRIRLVLPVQTSDRALLQALPWELLYSEQTETFLSRSVLTPVIRQLGVPAVSSALPTTSDQVRVLIAVAAPRGVVPLDEADERARILDAWCQQQGAEVEVLLSATQAKLYEALRGKHYQVVHFIAHGDFDSASGAGSLLLERSDGSPDLVPADLLAEALQASRELRLVFLNSCSTAQLGHRPGQDPLLGTGAALVRRGIPAILAMQFPISDVAARAFSEAVYRSLAGGSSLDSAVSDGRLAVLQACPGSWEWLTPVLLTAQSEASVFRPLCSAVEDRSARHSLVIVKAASFLAQGAFEDARRILDSCLEEGGDGVDLHYQRALALLEGRRPRNLKVPELRRVESSARAVLRYEDSAAHHFCLLAAVLKDFYIENHLVAPKPGYQEVLDRAANARLEDDKLADLVELAPWARAVADEVLERAQRSRQ